MFVVRDHHTEVSMMVTDHDHHTHSRKHPLAFSHGAELAMQRSARPVRHSIRVPAAEQRDPASRGGVQTPRIWSHDVYQCIGTLRHTTGNGTPVEYRTTLVSRSHTIVQFVNGCTGWGRWGLEGEVGSRCACSTTCCTVHASCMTTYSTRGTTVAKRVLHVPPNTTHAVIMTPYQIMARDKTRGHYVPMRVCRVRRGIITLPSHAYCSTSITGDATDAAG